MAFALLLGFGASGCGSSGGGSTTPAASRALLAYDARIPLDVAVQQDKTQGDLRVEQLTYVSDGQTIPALFARPRTGAPKGCLIWENGLGSRKEDTESAWEGVAHLGLATFSIDLRHHGARAPGFPKSLLTDVKDPATVLDMVHGSAIDLRRAIDFLESRPECRHNVGYVGWSLGGIVGTVLAGSDSRLKAVVLLSVPGNFHLLLQTTDDLLPGIEHHPAAFAAALRMLSPYDPDQWVADISPRPLLLMHGDNDTVVSKAAFDDLSSSATEPVTTLTYPGSHDPFIGAPAFATAVTITDFLRRNLSRTSSVPPD